MKYRLHIYNKRKNIKCKISAVTAVNAVLVCIIVQKFDSIIDYYNNNTRFLYSAFKGYILHNALEKKHTIYNLKN